MWCTPEKILKTLPFGWQWRTKNGWNEGWRTKSKTKNLERDPNFYARIGAKGGKNGRPGGFAANPELARIAGAKGGRISRRVKKTEGVAAAA